MRTQLEGVSPELGDTINTLIEARLVQVFTSMPAKIVKYYPDKQYADVQIQLKKKYEDGTLSPYPVIPNVPVKHPRAKGGKVKIHLPLKEGDDVELSFCMRSLDNWKTQGGMQDPADRRKFHITDATAYPGGSAEPDAFTVNDPDSLEIQNESGVVQIKSDGTINVGSYAPDKSAALGEAVQARLSTLESGLSSLVGEFNALVTAYTAHGHATNVPPVAPGTAAPPGVPAEPFTPDTSVVSSTKVKVKS